MNRTRPPRPWKLDAPTDPAARLLSRLPDEAPDAPETEQAWRRNVWRRLDAAHPRQDRARYPLVWLAIPAGAALLIALVITRRPVEPAPVVASLRVESASGTLLSQEDSGVWRQPSLGESLPASSKLRTGAHGRALVTLPTVADVLLQEGTTVAVAPTERATLLQLESGGLLAHVSHRPADHPFVVELHGVRVRVVGTVFSVMERPNGAVEVSVASGVVQVQAPTGPAVRVAAGQSWNSVRPELLAPDTIVPLDRSVVERHSVLTAAAAPPPAPDAVAPSTPPPTAPPVQAPPEAAVAQAEPPAEPAAVAPSLYDQAHRLQTQGDARGAGAALEQLIAHGDPRADIALYDLGRLRLRELADPKGALDAFYQYRGRYPDGPLKQEVDISIIEAVLATSDLQTALAEMTRFLAAYPDSERRSEVHLLRGNVQRESGQYAAALADYGQVGKGPFSDDALYFSAWCHQKLGESTAFKSALAEYLRLFPAGAHRAEVEAALRNP